jgi:hypothetical protein
MLFLLFWFSRFQFGGFRDVLYILLASNRNASKMPDAFFVILVQPLPRRWILFCNSGSAALKTLDAFLEFWFYRFQDAGSFFGNSGSAPSKTPVAFFGILVAS